MKCHSVKLVQSVSKASFIFLLSVMFGVCCFNPTNALAASISNRLAQFPDWSSKPRLERPQGELIYPDWLAGTWRVESVLKERVAPFAPEIVTPGFKSTESDLEQGIAFNVRFQPNPSQQIVADRVFNGQEAAKAYLGQAVKIAVILDPKNPNRQITQLPQGQQLIGVISGRRQQSPQPDQFLTTEMVQQFFQAPDSIYLNEVEITTAYQLLDNGQVQADQATAIYLAPQDPNYFQTWNHPVTLYRYQLELSPVDDLKQ